MVRVTSGRVLTAVAADGSTAQAVDEGLGVPILVLHGGMGDSSAWVRVTDLLRDRFRTVRLERRQYRLELPRKITMAQEVEHVTAVARRLDRPLLVGHSSGAVLALEALVAEPELYSGAVLYEPPAVIDKPLGGHSDAQVAAGGDPGQASDGRARAAQAEAKPGETSDARAREALAQGKPGETSDMRAREALAQGKPGETSGMRAREALAKGRPGEAMAIFLREVVELKPLMARLAGVAIGLSPALRSRVERQLDDLDAINELGVRLAAYARIELPILLLGGDKSPKHLSDRLDALEGVLPKSRRLLLHGQGHGAERSAPERVARAITKHIDEELAPR